MDESQPRPDGPEHPLSPELRRLLVCPVCRGELVDVHDGLRCPHDRLVFPIVDGVPWMLPERAKKG